MSDFLMKNSESKKIGLLSSLRTEELAVMGQFRAQQRIEKLDEQLDLLDELLEQIEEKSIHLDEQRAFDLYALKEKFQLANTRLLRACA